MRFLPPDERRVKGYCCGGRVAVAQSSTRNVPTTSAMPPNTLSPSLANNLLLEAELLRLTAAFQKAEIPYAVLKGIPLARELFGQLPKRSIVDNDLWVAPYDVARADLNLRSLGYQPTQHYHLATNNPFLWQCPYWREHQGQTLWVDLHWRLLSPHWFRDEVVFRRRLLRYVPVQDQAVPVLIPELSAIQLAAHHIQHQCAKPRILRELCAGLQRWAIPRNVLEHWTLSTHTQQALAACMFMAQELGWITGYERWPVSPQVKLFFTWYPPSAERAVNTPLRYLATHLLGDPRHAASSLMNDFFPTLEQMSQASNRPKSKALFVRYVTRNARAAVRLLKGQGFSVPPR